MPAKKRTDAFKASARSIPGETPIIEGEFAKWLGGFEKKNIAVVRLSIQGKAKAAQTFDVTLSSLPRRARLPRVTLQDEDEEPDGREGFTIGEVVPVVWRTAALDVAIQVVASQWAHEYDLTPVEKRPKWPL